MEVKYLLSNYEQAWLLTEYTLDHMDWKDDGSGFLKLDAWLQYRFPNCECHLHSENLGEESQYFLTAESMTQIIKFKLSWS